ncbi:hypothetical protein D9615_004838 [Tricholomella constricta]|uniref:Reverse transcriptase domain-containing protein n=1 Tax=Tricholomella constricta TaxID=117010 RepID=A0A8H5HGT6_9AGAR|nr:hypothetical protein D9615_004838 [Tricholomella constricta]
MVSSKRRPTRTASNAPSLPEGATHPALSPITELVLSDHEGDSPSTEDIPQANPPCNAKPPLDGNTVISPTSGVLPQTSTSTSSTTAISTSGLASSGLAPLPQFSDEQLQAAHRAVVTALQDPLASTLHVPQLPTSLDAPSSSSSTLPAQDETRPSRSKGKGRAPNPPLGPDEVDEALLASRPVSSSLRPLSPSRPAVRFSRTSIAPASSSRAPPAVDPPSSPLVVEKRAFTEDELVDILRAYGDELLQSLGLSTQSTGAPRSPPPRSARESNSRDHCHSGSHAAWCNHPGAERPRSGPSRASHSYAPYPAPRSPRIHRNSRGIPYVAPSPSASEHGSADSSFSPGDSLGNPSHAPDFSAELNANEIVTPDRIVRILRGGWLDYIPLDSLTNDACRSASFAPLLQDDAAIALQAGGRLHVRSSALDCSRELRIPILGWMQATRNFVEAIRYHYHSASDRSPGGPSARRIAASFKAHYKLIMRRPDFESNFATYVEYDVFIRRQFLSRLHSGRPMFPLDQFHDSVFQTYDRARVARAMTSLSSSSNAAPSSSLKPFRDHRISESAAHADSSAAHSRTSRSSSGRERNIRCITSSSRPTGNGKGPEGSCSASGGMAPVPAPNPDAITLTPVRSAELLSTVHNSALCEFHLPITTPLRPERWTALLQETGGLPRFAAVPDGLIHGFSLGLENFHLDHTYSPPNHYKSPEHHAFVISKYAEEIRLGRVSPGYPPHVFTSLFGHYRTAPLNVIERHPGKFRITVDHSYPRDNPLIPSINSEINSKHFQCAWGTFSVCYLLVADAPPGTEACVFDVDSAFRNIPTRPIDRTATAILIDGLVHLDGRLNFGICPAPGIFGLVADAIVWIYLHKGIDAVIKWVDDFIFFRYLRSHPGSRSYFSYDETLIWSIADDLGWPWAPDKFVPFATSFTYIGFEWSLSANTSSMPPHRSGHQVVLRLSADWTARLFRPRTPAVLKGQRPSAHRQPWQIPASLQEHANTVLSRAWKPSTSAGYSRSVDQFFAFCSNLNAPASAWLPASEDLLCAFAASFSGTLAASSIRSKCAALRSWHILNGLPWLGSTKLAYTIKGCESMRPPSSFTAKRNPVTIQMLTAILSGLDPACARDSCTVAIACTAFWGQLRLGELLPDREGLLSADRLPRWRDLHSPNSRGTRLLHLPQSKTSGYKGEDVVITRQATADPIQHLADHGKHIATVDSWPLAWYASSAGSPVALTKRKFLLRCNGILAALALPHISGHSFRIGGTTHFLLSGVAPDIVKIMGRWSSDSFLRYWRCLEVIAPLHAELLEPIVLRNVRPSASSLIGGSSFSGSDAPPGLLRSG